LFELSRQTINRYNFFISLKYWGKLIRLFDILITHINYKIMQLFFFLKRNNILHFFVISVFLPAIYSRNSTFRSQTNISAELDINHYKICHLTTKYRNNRYANTAVAAVV